VRLKLLPLPSPFRVAETSATLDSHGTSAKRSMTRATPTVPDAVPETLRVDEPTGAAGGVTVESVEPVESVAVVVGTAAGATIDAVCTGASNDSDVRNESVGTIRANSFSARSQFMREEVTFAITETLAAVEA